MQRKGNKIGGNINCCRRDTFEFLIPSSTPGNLFLETPSKKERTPMTIEVHQGPVYSTQGPKR
jgi:hypothetical protein